MGAGTLVLDQLNDYSGDTQVKEGTLWLRGWGTVGSDSGTAIVDDGASLMFTYTLGYGDEKPEIANNIELAGAGDEQWEAPLTGDESQSSTDTPHSSTDGLTAALISAVGRSVVFTLSGDIKGDGGLLHSGDGTLVLSGDSTYTGGTVITRGVVEVQSATGLGATADGQSSVKLGKDADLHVTVDGYTSRRMATKLAAADDRIEGDVYITGTKYTERVLHMEGNGYMASSTSLGDNGTFLLSGRPIGEIGISSTSGDLTGSGTVVVSDATGSGTTATFKTMTNYTGDFRVEGDNASIHVDTGSHEEGSIHVAGRQASVHIGSNVSIAAGETLHLRSTGVAGTDAGTSALLASDGEVSVASGAVFSVSNAETKYSYDLSNLQAELSVTPEEVTYQLQEAAETGERTMLGDNVDYAGCFDSSIAVNQQASGAVQAAGGLTLAGGSTYDTQYAHTSLLGGLLTLNASDNLITLKTRFEADRELITDDMQLVLFSDVGSVNFVLDGELAEANTGVYYTRADRYLTGCDYVDEESVLVYDSQAGVVYLKTSVLIPEPSTTALSLLALSGLLARRRRRD